MFLEDSFDAAHSVASFGEGHKCFGIHGHTYHIRLEVGGPLDMARGVVIDFDTVKAAWRPIRERLDHKNINNVVGANATSELLAVYIFGQLGMSIPGLCRVEVRETDKCGAIMEVA